ncbi:hypothetical protein L7F22_065047 [Adiantum nelumboides]|nr:hypothetical protein [Adiantum nelumboides]
MSKNLQKEERMIDFGTLDLQNDVASPNATWAIDFLARKLQEAMANLAWQGVVRTQLQERHLTIPTLEENSPSKSQHAASKRGNLISKRRIQPQQEEDEALHRESEQETGELWRHRVAAGKPCIKSTEQRPHDLPYLVFRLPARSANLWYSSLILPWHVGQQMLEMVDWSYVCEALDIGCGSGMLLNAVAMRLKKEHTGGSVIGVDLWLDGDGKSMSSTLQSAVLEQVHQYVMCKTGDPRSLPFEDDQFDLVVSALCLHKLGSDCGPQSTEACCERLKGLQELVRVLKPGGQAVLWDLCHVLEYASKLEDLNMCNVKVSNCIPAYMMQSHIVSFKKPPQRISF